MRFNVYHAAALQIATGIYITADERTWPNGTPTILREMAEIDRQLPDERTIGQLALAWLAMRTADLQSITARAS